MANRHPDDARFLQTRLWRDHLQPRQLHIEPLCRRCKAKGRTTVADQVDHIVVPNGNGILQRDPSNHQSLCASCHSIKTNGQGRGWTNEMDADGYPLSPIASIQPLKPRGGRGIFGRRPLDDRRGDARRCYLWLFRKFDGSAW